MPQSRSAWTSDQHPPASTSFRRDKFPYNTPTWYTYDSGRVRPPARQVHGYGRTGRATRSAARSRKKAGKLRGRSVCYYIEFGCIFNDRRDIRFDPGGTVTGVRWHAYRHSDGQGHATVFAQLVHEFLGGAVRVDPLRAGRYEVRCSSAAALTARAARLWAARR